MQSALHDETRISIYWMFREIFLFLIFFFFYNFHSSSPFHTWMRLHKKKLKELDFSFKNLKISLILFHFDFHFKLRLLHSKCTECMLTNAHHSICYLNHNHVSSQVPLMEWINDEKNKWMKFLQNTWVKDSFFLTQILVNHFAHYFIVYRYTSKATEPK